MHCLDWAYIATISADVRDWGKLELIVVDALGIIAMAFGGAQAF